MSVVALSPFVLRFSDHHRSISSLPPAHNGGFCPSSRLSRCSRKEKRSWSSSSSSPEPLVTGQVNHAGDPNKLSDNFIDSNGEIRKQPEKSDASNELVQKLRRYGVAGVLSYGLLNTVYYLTTFLVVWFYVAPAPAKLGYATAVGRFVKVMAMVWAGSQVTKLLRAGGALALAPLVDKGLSWFTLRFKFESKGKAFVAIAGLCFGMAVLLFFVLTLLWA